MASGQVVYPERWVADVVLADGGAVHIRPLVPADAPAIEQFHSRQSRESIYFRYFSPMPTLTRRELARLTNVDYVSHMAFVAELGDDLVGLASYDVWPGRNVAEVAFLVDDEHQGRGLATVLLEYLVVAARENGLEALIAQVLPNNRRMVSVFNQVGFEVASEFAEGVIEVRLELEPTPQSAARIETRERLSEARSIERLLYPSSIAVIGAGRDPEGLGTRVLRNLVAHGFGHRVFPVNPRGVDVDGFTGYSSITEIDDDIDLAIVAVPARAVAEVVEECGRARVHGLVIISAGFGTRPDGRSAEAVLVDRALRFGMRVIGPESLGVVNTSPECPVFATFADVATTAGGVGFLTQSGTLGIAALEHARRTGIGISAFVDIGSRIDVSGNDLLQFWRDDPRTSVVLLYLETFGNPRKFTRIARQIARTKPIVAVKTGGTLAAEHDDPVDGLGAVWPPDATTAEALLAQSGVIRVGTPSELFAVARMLLHQPVPRGAGVAVVCNSKGARTLATDACTRAGLTVTTTTEMDWQAGPEQYRRAVDEALSTEAVDSVLLVYAPPRQGRRAEVGAAVAAVVQAHAATGTGGAKPVVATFLGDGAATFTWGDVTIPLFEFPGEAAHVLGLAVQHGQWLNQPAGVPATVAGDRIDAARAVVGAILDPEPRGRWLDRDEAAALLRSAGFRMAEHRTVDSADDAVAAAHDLGFPVVLKATGVERFHRGEGGGVTLDLHDGNSVRGAFGRMVELLGDAMHPAVVQQMVPPGADVLVGAHQHPSFGGVISVGIGGVMAAANPELPMRILPLTDADAERLVSSSPIASVLAAEDKDGRATSAVQAFLAQLSAVLEQLPEIADVLLNPLIVDATGACIVDAWVRVAPYDWDPWPAVRRL